MNQKNLVFLTIEYPLFCNVWFPHLILGWPTLPLSPSYIHVGKGHTHMNAAVTESEQTCKVYFHTYKFKIENVDTRSHTHCF